MTQKSHRKPPCVNEDPKLNLKIEHMVFYGGVLFVRLFTVQSHTEALSFLVEKLIFLDQCACNVFRSVVLKKLNLPAAVLKCTGWQRGGKIKP